MDVRAPAWLAAGCVVVHREPVRAAMLERLARAPAATQLVAARGQWLRLALPLAAAQEQRLRALQLSAAPAVRALRRPAGSTPVQTRAIARSFRSAIRSPTASDLPAATACRSFISR